MNPVYFTKSNGEKLAYHHTKATEVGAHLPAVMFLGGFKSDMMGTKALFLEAQAKQRGQEFVRFDYRGHGQSDGEFEEGTIGAWAEDAMDILDHIVTDDVILVGSSMGGWVSLLLLLNRTQRVLGMVGIAAAPDFTKDIEAELSSEQKDVIEKDGRLEVPNDYDDNPYVFTKALLDDGALNCVLNKEQTVSRPMTLLQGKQDADVPWQKALKIKDVFSACDVDVIFIDDGDHRLSRDQDLQLIDNAVQALSRS